MSSENNKYRVCIITAILPPAYGGAEVAAFNYAKRLSSNADAEILVIGWDRTGLYKKSKDKYEFVYPVQFPENPKDAKGVLIYLQQYGHLMNCFIALMKPMWKFRKQYDYVHNFNSGFAFNRVSILIAKLLGKKVVTETSLVGDDDPVTLGRINNWKDYLKPKFVRYMFYRMADRYVSKSNVITEIFKKSKINFSKVEEIPYSVDVRKFAPLEMSKKSELRKKLKLWENGIVILFVGGINVRKGVHLLVDAFAQIESRNPEAKLLIVGPTYKYDPKYISKIKEKIIEKKLQDKVHLTEENADNVEEFMQCSDIFVLPSRQEGFPISIIEAMSSGLAVIGSDIPEIAKAQINNGEDGYLFPTGDVDKLAVIMEKLLRDRDEILRVSKKARKKVQENWSTEIVDDKYRKLYKSM